MVQQKNKQNSGDKITAVLLDRVRQYFPAHALAVAVSGGMDSMSLLYAARKVARERGLALHAFHVHHGLQRQADEWLNFIRDYCIKNDIHFCSTALNPQKRASAQSIEDWARQGRYAALSAMAQAQGVLTVWLAQHEDDQIETHVLQKMRGAGAKGLSAMPTQFNKAGVSWQRPWLAVCKQQIEDYATQQRIPFIQDPSNLDIRFARNALRAQWQAHPLSATERLRFLQDIQAAQLQQQQDDAWAEGMLKRYVNPHRADIGEVSRLSVPNWLNLNTAQQAVLLRAWLAVLGVRMPSRVALDELMKQLSNPRADQHMRWLHPDGLVLTRFRGYFMAAYHVEGLYTGRIEVQPTLGEGWGIDPDIWRSQNFTIKPRIGGERIRLHPKRPRSDLKKAFLEQGIAPALRDHLPLLYCGDQLVYAAGLGLNMDACVQNGLRLHWVFESAHHK